MPQSLPRRTLEETAKAQRGVIPAWGSATMRHACMANGITAVSKIQRGRLRAEPQCNPLAARLLRHQPPQHYETHHPGTQNGPHCSAKRHARHAQTSPCPLAGTQCKETFRLPSTYLPPAPVRSFGGFDPNRTASTADKAAPPTWAPSPNCIGQQLEGVLMPKVLCGYKKLCGNWHRCNHGTIRHHCNRGTAKGRE